MTTPTNLASLRQALLARLDEVERMVAPGFDREPTFPGLVNTWRHTCGRDGCRCQQGEKHRSTRLCIFFADGTAQRSLSEEEAESWRARTGAYRRVRQSARALRRWAKEVAQLLESIEQARRSLDGLSPEDRKRPLR